MNKNKVHLFLSIIAGLGLGLVLTYAFNTSASGLSSFLSVDDGATFNVKYSDGNQVKIKNTTGELGVGTISMDSNYKITTSGGGIKAESTSQPAGYFNSSSGYGLIVNAGNVGIGTTAPTRKLHVEGGQVLIAGASGATSPTGQLVIKSTTSGNNSVGHIRFVDNANTSYGYIGDASISDSNLYINSEVGNLVLASNAFRVGIGTTNPLSKLSIGGMGDAGVALSVDGPIQIDGQQSGYSKPACGISTSGTIWVDDLAAGYEFQVCLRVGNGVYSWKNISVN